MRVKNAGEIRRSVQGALFQWKHTLGRRVKLKEDAEAASGVDHQLCLWLSNPL
jgi:hypothetical protein